MNQGHVGYTGGGGRCGWHYHRRGCVDKRNAPPILADCSGWRSTHRFPGESNFYSAIDAHQFHAAQINRREKSRR
eukprot:2660758-Pyramimonas_sp.AAC.1